MRACVYVCMQAFPVFVYGTVVYVTYVCMNESTKCTMQYTLRQT